MSKYPDAGFDAEVLCMPGTSGCFFLRRVTPEREQCANSLEVLGWTASRRAGRDRELTPSVSSNIGKNCMYYMWVIVRRLVATGEPGEKKMCELFRRYGGKRWVRRVSFPQATNKQAGNQVINGALIF